MHANSPLRSTPERSLRVSALLAGVAALISCATAFAAPTALLSKLTGSPAIFEVGGERAQPVSLVKLGHEYALPLEVVTGVADSAAFTLPSSLIEVSPNTVMRIVAPESSDTSVIQRVLQRTGAALFSVKKGSVTHFQVDTPFLVSVVKGTTFNVLVEDSGATVALHEGSLLVTSVDGSQRILLAPGDVAFAGRDGQLRELKFERTQGGVQLTESHVKSDAAERSDTPDGKHLVGTTDTVQTLTNGVSDPVGGTTTVLATTTESVTTATTGTTTAVGSVVESTVEVTTGTVATVTTVVVDPVVTPVMIEVPMPTIEPLVEATLAPIVDPAASVGSTPLLDPVNPIVAPLPTVGGLL